MSGSKQPIVVDLINHEELRKALAQLKWVHKKHDKSTCVQPMPTLLINCGERLLWPAEQCKDDNQNLIDKYKTTIQLSLDKDDPRGVPEDVEAYKGFKIIEEYLYSMLHADSLKWLGKNVKSLEAIEGYVNPVLHFPKKEKSEERDYTKNPSVHGRINFYQKKDRDRNPTDVRVWGTSIYSPSLKPLFMSGPEHAGTQFEEDGTTPLTPLRYMKWNTTAPQRHCILLELSAMWIANSKASWVFNFKQVKLIKQENTQFDNSKCYFAKGADASDDEEDEGVVHEHPEESVAKKRSAEASGLETIDSSDDEDAADRPDEEASKANDDEDEERTEEREEEEREEERSVEPVKPAPKKRAKKN